MSEKHFVKAGCLCGAVKWTAPAPQESEGCSCGYCENTGANWSYCDPNEFALDAIDGSVRGYQFDAYSPRHYYCTCCGTPLWTWTADSKRVQTGEMVSDYENPNLNWNTRLAGEPFIPQDDKGVLVELETGQPACRKREKDLVVAA